MITIAPPADASDDEIAAALAAIQSLLASEVASDGEPARAPWRESGRLLAQDITPARLPAPTWGNIERLRRLRGRSYRT